MEEKVVLSFDIGTQSTRAVLVNNSGELIAKKQIKYDVPYVSEEKGWAEKDADSYFETAAMCAKELSEKYPKVFENIKAVTVTCIRDSIVNVDSNGKPLRPCVTWLDSRQVDDEPEFPKTSKAIFSVVGLQNFVTLQYKKSIVNWIMKNQPEIWEKTYKVMLLSGYIVYKLTGNLTDACASVVGHIPFDVKKRTWSGKNALTRPIFDIPNEKLFDITESCEVMGNITKEVSELTGIKEGTPVIASGSDKACEMIGLGCVKKDVAAISFGTMCSVSFNTPDYLEAQNFVPPYPSIIKGWYNPEQELYRGYWLVSWFKKEFCEAEAIEAMKERTSLEEYLNKGLLDIEPGCNGLFLSPYFSPDVMQPVARGGFIGLSDYHTKKHMYRAIIEGINFDLLEGLREIERKGKLKFKEIRVGGGGSQSDEICQITADMFGVPVSRTSTHEVSALGSAIATFVGLNEFESYEDAVNNMVRVTDTFTPNMENNKKYNKLFEVYKKIYPKLKPLYEEIAEILK